MQQRLPMLGYAVLAQLCREPMTGYELARRMQGAMAYFWTAPHSQIYPQLARLTEQGLVIVEAAAGPGPRDKKTYRPTVAGRSLLASWVIEPVQPAAVRSETALKAYAASVADPDALADTFRGEAERHRARLADYQVQERELRDSHGDGLDDPAEPAFGNYSALALGLSAERGAAEWCDWMADRLSASGPAPTNRAGRRTRAGRTSTEPSGSG